MKRVLAVSMFAWALLVAEFAAPDVTRQDFEGSELESGVVFRIGSSLIKAIVNFILNIFGRSSASITTTSTTAPTTTTPTITSPTVTSARTPCSCGSATRSTLRLAEGNLATTSRKSPWHMIILPNANRSAVCGGALIDPSWVLTAATCIHGAKTAIVRAGRLISVDSSSPTRQSRTGDVTIHVNYTFAGVGYRNNDVALVRLRTPFNITPSVSPICMAIKEASFPFTGRFVNMAGWGLNSAGERILQSTRFTVLNTTSPRCPVVSFPHRTFCLYTSTTQSFCNSGDGGSPITWFDTTVNSAKLLGLVGEAVTFCNNFPPSAVRVTRISRYLNWISSTTGVNFCIP